MLSLKSIHPQNRLHISTFPCYKIKLTGVFVDWLQKNHSIHTLREIKYGLRVVGEDASGTTKLSGRGGPRNYPELPELGALLLVCSIRSIDMVFW